MLLTVDVLLLLYSVLLVYLEPGGRVAPSHCTTRDCRRDTVMARVMTVRQWNVFNICLFRFRLSVKNAELCFVKWRERERERRYREILDLSAPSSSSNGIVTEDFYS